ncbi:MAG TPA: complex I subunit 5 family protein [Methylorubrum populi]|uniref:Complex I subunit 5 family protein n=1 Tax=Methylorubrum populi TaxID=223967 RepID=A0A921JF54_9HYPH|nr:complex I subunit 5 family protein [Methylorubrum populi]
MTPDALLPVAVLLPLGVATLLLALAHWLPPRLPKVVAILTALAVCGLCAFLARHSLDGPVRHWFAGWTPDATHRPGIVLGIGFQADPASAALAAFCGLLFTASFVFAWGYFDTEHAHFHVLMLLFLAAMVGFCLTRDLFNLFVWFELMSVAAFALTAYPLGRSALEGAFTFTITNALASFLMLAATGLLYARTGTFDFAAMGQAVARTGSDPVLTGGFVLVASALLTKAAILPFHLWLADAHAVAPSPVSVIFSGAMVSLALFGLAKLVAQVFSGDPQVMALVRGLLLWLGLATALVAGLTAFAQRHLKRLLAFSTIAHLGIMLTALAAGTGTATAGLLLYVVGHGLVKGALFMVAGMLLALRQSADEIVLYGQGRGLWAPALAMGVGGLMLGGLPLGLMHGATHWMDVSAAAPAKAVVTLASALTGAAVLRAAARIFLGASGVPGPELLAPTEREREKADRPLWLMAAPALALVVLALAPSKAVMPFLGAAAARLRDPSLPPLTLPEAGFGHLTPLGLTLALLGLALLRRRAVRGVSRGIILVERRSFGALQALHSGLVGDYVTWMAVGLALFALACAGQAAG